MSKRNSSKYKIDRRMGENIWGRPKSSVNRRSYGPGQHGQRRKGKLSDFGIQLRAKQKLKGYYGDVTEKQFKATYQQAARMKGDTGQNLIGLLEQRLDMIVYRAKFAPTIFSARQIVSHGHIYVNGVKCNIASRRVRPGDVISLGKKAKEMALIAEAQSLPERVHRSQPSCCDRLRYSPERRVQPVLRLREPKRAAWTFRVLRSRRQPCSDTSRC